MYECGVSTTDNQIQLVALAALKLGEAVDFVKLNLELGEDIKGPNMN